MACLVGRGVVVGVEEGSPGYLPRCYHCLILGMHAVNPVLINCFRRTPASKRNGMEVEHVGYKAPGRVAVFVNALHKHVLLLPRPLVSGGDSCWHGFWKNFLGGPTGFSCRNNRGGGASFIGRRSMRPDPDAYLGRVFDTALAVLYLAGKRCFQHTFAAKINESKNKAVQGVIFWDWRAI